MKFRKKPVVIEAIQWNGENKTEIIFFINETSFFSEEGILFIDTLEGKMKASISDWIIKDVNGEFYPCKPDIFEKTYDIIK